MDLLSQRYADPYLILDDFIRLQQLHGFLETIMQSIAEEKVQDIRWMSALHRPQRQRRSPKSDNTL